MPREAFWLSPHDRLKVYASIAALGGAVVVVVALLAVFIAFAWPTTGIGNPTTRINAGAVSRFQVGTPVQFPEGKFWLVKQEDGSFIALSWKSTHRGCTVHWRENFVFTDPKDGQSKRGWFRDPCSGATWDVNGLRVFGPAPRDLDRFPVEVVRGKVYVLVAERLLIRGNSAQSAAP